MRVAVDRYLLDKAAIERRYEVPYSPVRQRGSATSTLGWQKRLAEADFNALERRGQDRLRPAAQSHRVRPGVAHAGRYAVAADGGAAAVLPTRCGCSRRIGTIASASDPRATATTLERGRAAGREPDAVARRGRPTRRRPGHPSRHHAGHRGARRRRRSTRSAPCSPTGTAFYDGYDPIFSWWMRRAVRPARQGADRATRTRFASIWPASGRASRRRSSATRCSPRACAPTWRSR